MQDNQTQPAIAPGEQHAHVPLTTLLMCFLRLGGTAFGGGTVGWTYREVVERRHWMSEHKFLKILTMSQILPGANVVNLAVYLGMSLRGLRGAAVAAFGIIALPFVILLTLGAIYSQVSGSTVVQTVLTGLACVGLAAMLHTSIRNIRRLKSHVFLIAVAAVVFVLVGLLRWSMIGVVAVAVPVSILVSYWLQVAPENE